MAYLQNKLRVYEVWQTYKLLPRAGLALVTVAAYINPVPVFSLSHNDRYDISLLLDRLERKARRRIMMERYLEQCCAGDRDAMILDSAQMPTSVVHVFFVKDAFVWG